MRFPFFRRKRKSLLAAELERCHRYVQSLEQKHRLIRGFMVVLGVVLVWRGLWNVLDKFFFPDNFFLSNALSLLVGLSLLYMDDYKLDELE